MIWEAEVQTIVMVCNEIEAGRPKCERYWTQDSEVKQFGKISVKLIEQKDFDGDYKAREFVITYGDMSRNIHHFHYHTWPDHGAPLSVRAMINMVKTVRIFQVTETVPLLVHCSAGCGRTGTVCAIDYVCGLLRIGKLTEDFSLKQLVFEMRKQRIAMVQTAEQYMVVYRAVRELFEEHLKVIDSHPYANIDFTRKPCTVKIESEYENIVRRRDDPIVSDTKVPPLPKKNRPEHLTTNKLEHDKLPKCEVYLESNLTDKSSLNSKSRMDYVKDWCDGILSTKPEANESLSVEVDGEPVAGATCHLPVPTPGQGSLSAHSPKSQIYDEKSLKGKSNFTNLVRRPSMARFRALFDAASNSGSSGTSSPETKTKSSPRNSPILRKPLRSRSKVKNEELKDDVCFNVLSRYDDTSYRIFKENRNLLSEFNNVNARSTPSPSSRSGDDLSISGSPSPKIYRHRKYLSVSHSPLPTSTSENVMKDLVTRVVGSSRRNSYAEKRCSTWYDDTNPADEASFTNPTRKVKDSASVKRSISMKVGFRSPMFSRKKDNGDVAPYLAVENLQSNNSTVKYTNLDVNNANVSKDLVKISKESQKNLKDDQSSKHVIKTLKDEKVEENNIKVLKPSENHVKDHHHESKIATKFIKDDKQIVKMPIEVENEPIIRAKEQIKTVPVPSPRLSRSNLLTVKENLRVIEKNHDYCNIRLPELHDEVHENVKTSEKCSNSVEFVKDANNEYRNPDDLYGSEMDAYCQQIIRDCQTYLHSRQSIYLPSELKEDEVANECTAKSSSFEEHRNQNHDYEKLWFSHSAPVVEPEVQNAPAKQIYANHSIARRSSRSVEHFGTDVVERAHRKPQPAPRTILSYCKSQVFDGEDGTNRNSMYESQSDVPTSHFPVYQNFSLNSKRLHEVSSSQDAVVNDYSDSISSSSDPVYRSVNKHRSRDLEGKSSSDMSEVESELVALRKKYQINSEENCELLKPIAPPRLRRKHSISSTKTAESTHHETRPMSLELEKVFYFDPSEQLHHSLPEKYVDSDDADEIPPVPVKTKDAYRLPHESPSCDLNSEFSPRSNSTSTSASNSTLNLSKVFNKLQNNLSKIAQSHDDKEVDSSFSVSSRRPAQRCLVVPGFPDRLSMKPKGPREPPHHFKVSCTL
ncbi:hypothetical protein CHUAL_005405 [Chamberlinius hualienensis]